MLASLQRTRARYACSFAVSVVVVLAAVVTAPGAAWGKQFQRGDVFLTGSGSVQEYSPSGQLQQTLPATSGSDGLCFDPSGRHLIVPGVGMFDVQGNALPSQWATATAADHDCVADGVGHVYIGTNTPAGSSINQYDLEGDLIRTFPAAPTGGSTGGQPLSIDLGPDECTMYYDAENSGWPQIGRFNVCTSTQETPFASDLNDTVFDDLRVLPNWQVAATFDTHGVLFDASGAPIGVYAPSSPFTDSLRNMSLDPDGTSLWICCSGGDINRFDITSGSLLSQWSAFGFSQIAVYGPPLLGNANVAPNVVSRPAGTAEAFVTRTQYSGTLARLHLWVGGSTSADSIAVGIYSNSFGHPGALQAQGTISNVIPGTWNYVDVPSMPVTAGQLYWIALLGRSGGGTVAVRDRAFGAVASVDARRHLTALPQRWSVGGWSISGSLSAFGS